MCSFDPTGSMTNTVEIVADLIQTGSFSGSKPSQDICVRRTARATCCTVGMCAKVYYFTSQFITNFYPQQLKDSEFSKAYNSLELFAYGTYKDYEGKKVSIEFTIVT